MKPGHRHTLVTAVAWLLAPVRRKTVTIFVEGGVLAGVAVVATMLLFYAGRPGAAVFMALAGGLIAVLTGLRAGAQDFINEQAETPNRQILVVDLMCPDDRKHLHGGQK